MVKPRAEYVPERGDVVWLDFTPQAGREQAGHRPALVLTPSVYNRASGLMIACPLTSKRKGYPFEVRVPAGKPLPAEGVVLCDQVRSLDWRARGVKRVGTLPPAILAEVHFKVGQLLRFNSSSI
jgi:mRNA interferase MazF